MEVLRKIVLISYYPIIIVLIVVINIFLVRLFRTINNIGDIAKMSSGINNGLSSIQNKTAEIEKTKQSWSFFVSIYVIFVVIREILSYRKRNYSLGKSISKAAVNHSKQLSKIRF